MPPRILAIEFGVVALQVLAALDARLAIGNRNIFQTNVVSAEERTLTTKSLILNQFPFLYSFISISVAKLQK